MAAPLIANELKCSITNTEVRSCWHVLCRGLSNSVKLYQRDEGIQTRPTNEGEEKYPTFSGPRASFRTLDIQQSSKSMDKRRGNITRPRREEKPWRMDRMKTDQDWTAVWPGAKTFNWSVVPLPIRQGAAKATEGNRFRGEFGMPPYKYANLELLKIPNFLHLTPKHIKQQCEAIKKYCSRWPSELSNEEQIKKHFPMEVVTSDFCFSGPSVRDPRARTVTIKFKLSDLELDEHALDKIKILLKKKYDSKTDTVTLVADRCPLKQQNYDYLQYIMTALYFESWKVEPWEAERTWKDRSSYMWEESGGKRKITNLLNIYKEKLKDLDESKRSQFSHLSSDLTEDTVSSLDVVKTHKSVVEDLQNAGEDDETIDNYKQSVLNMLKIQTTPKQAQTAKSEQS